MDPTCKLCSKCLKEDENLEKFRTPACENMIHVSCSKHLLMTFGVVEWEGTFFVASIASSTTRSHSKTQQSKQKEGFHGIMMGLLDWLTASDNYNCWHRGHKHKGS